MARAGDGTRMSVLVSVPPRLPLRVLSLVCAAYVEILFLDTVYGRGVGLGCWSEKWHTTSGLRGSQVAKPVETMNDGVQFFSRLAKVFQ